MDKINIITLVVAFKFCTHNAGDAMYEYKLFNEQN